MSGSDAATTSVATAAKPMVLRTTLRVKVTRPGVDELISVLGPSEIPNGLIPPVTRLNLDLPHGIVFQMRGSGTDANVSPMELAQRGTHFSWVSLSGAEIKVRREGKHWNVTYVGPTNPNRDESNLMRFLTHSLRSWWIPRYTPRIKPRSDLARSRMVSMGFVEVDERGVAVAVDR